MINLESSCMMALLWRIMPNRLYYKERKVKKVRPTFFFLILNISLVLSSYNYSEHVLKEDISSLWN